MNLKQSFVLTLLITLVQLSNFTAAQESTPSQEDLDQITSIIALVQNSIAETRIERSSVENELIKIEKDIVNLNQQTLYIEEQIESQISSLAELRQRSDIQQTSKIEQQALIGQYLTSAYKAGQEEYLKLLLNQQSIEQASRALKYYEYFTRARTEKVEVYKATIIELDRLQHEIQLTTVSLEENRSELLKQQTLLASTQSQRQSLLTELDSNLDRSSAELARLEQERSDTELLLKELANAMASLSLNDQPFAETKGQMPWPSNGPLLNSFGTSYGLGDLDWEGVTIEGTEGDPVQAIHAGRVLFADWFSNSGLLLIIDHGDGYISLYSRNQLLYKEVGDWVTSGDIIAAIGNTGGRNENGVYFEIRHDGQPLDPVNWCIARN